MRRQSSVKVLLFTNLELEGTVCDCLSFEETYQNGFECSTRSIMTFVGYVSVKTHL